MHVLERLLRRPQLFIQAAGDPVCYSHDGYHGVNTTRAGEDARICDVEVLPTPYFAPRIDDAVLAIGTHPTSAHEVGR